MHYDTLLAATKANALSAGFGGDDSPTDSRWIAAVVMVAASAVVVGLVVAKLRKWRLARAESGAGIARDLRRHLRLTRRQVRCLRLAADELDLPSPTSLLLCPSMLRVVRPRLPIEYASEADAILRRLAA